MNINIICSKHRPDLFISKSENMNFNYVFIYEINTSNDRHPPQIDNLIRHIKNEAYKCFKSSTQPAIACSKLTIETLEQGVKYVQS